MSWSMSPMKTPSRRTSNSEYETAYEDDDSDSSLYYSMTDGDRTLENKENSLNISSKSSKKVTKGATPLLRKTLQKNLVESMTPLKHVNTNASFHADVNDATDTSPIENETSTGEAIVKNDSDASGIVDESCDTTVIDTTVFATVPSDAAVTEPPVVAPKDKTKSVSFPACNIKLIVSDYDNPKKQPMLVAETVSKLRVSDTKRVSLTKKAIKTVTANASVRNHRQQLAIEAKQVPAKTVRKTVSIRSSMYQPRKSSTRRSMDAKVARANQSLAARKSTATNVNVNVAATAQAAEATDNRAANKVEKVQTVNTKQQRPATTASNIAKGILFVLIFDSFVLIFIEFHSDVCNGNDFHLRSDIITCGIRFDINE